ncbi:MAG TPA: dephospho-CoA kinase [Thiobacillus sp.]
MLVIGLTGGIGSGKSTVSDLFAEKGVPVIDTDLIARQLTAPGGEALAAIRNAFTDVVLHADGTLDRAQLRGMVFNDASARGQLEAILHPRIRLEVERLLARVQSPYVVIVIPLLVENGGYGDLLSRVLVVDCPETLQMERVMARSRLTREEVAAVMAAQTSRALRLSAADDVLVNTGTQDVLQAEAERLHQRYLKLGMALMP